MKKVFKGKQGVKGNKKISDFFTKRPSGTLESNNHKATTSEEVKIIEENASKPEAESASIKLKNSSCNKENLSKVKHEDLSLVFKVEEVDQSKHLNGETSILVNSAKRSLELSPTLTKKKQRRTESVIIEQVKSDNVPNGNKLNASTPPGTPTKSKPKISLKSPEKLLSTKALKEHHTPKKLQNQFVEICSSPDLFNSLTKNSSKLNNVNRKSPKKPPQAKQETPTKSKRTPTKLFQRSPNNLNEFNVQVINAFVKVTPSKSNEVVKDDEVLFVSSNEKKQSSILKYISPSSSTKLRQSQNQNEKTSKKSPDNYDLTFGSSTSSSASRVKTRLDFSDNREDILENGQNSFCFDDNWDENLLDHGFDEYNLDLTESHRCKILNITSSINKRVLTLQSTSNSMKAICLLEGVWVHVLLNNGDYVHVMAKKLNDNWVISSDHGVIVYEPDILVSTTSVVGSLWCKRRSILNEKFKGFEAKNEAMLLGSLVHVIFQRALKNKISNEQEIWIFAKTLIKEPKMIRELYELDLTEDHIEKELAKYIPNICQFVSVRLKNKQRSKQIFNKNDWQGSIQTIEDIEENIWCPELGLKGKIDVTIKTNLQEIMPLELKTGRATVSLEHRGQVIMYIMMMNKLGYNVPSGLLFYLREGVLKEIPPTPNEKRDLILLRNELTYYHSRKVKIEEEEGTKKIYPPKLPETINHPSCCKCPQNVICTSYIRYNKEDVSSNKVLRNLQSEMSETLTDSHLNYIMKWVSLLSLESDSNSQKSLQQIYTIPPEKREKCISNLRICSVGDECNEIYEHTFAKLHDKSNLNFFSSGIMEGNYIIVSTDKRPAVASGFITEITTSSITVTLDRNLSDKFANMNFHLDSYESSSLQAFNLCSLSLLLEISPRAERLRQLIIDKVPPVFKSTLPKIIGQKGKMILKRLNIVQQRALLRAIAAEDYFLIEGLPGTGKTATIVALIQLLNEIGKSVLITSHTHSAIDNICVQLLKYGVKLMRLGSESRLDQDVLKCSERALTKHCSSPEDLKKIYNETQIVAVTCMGSGHPLLTKRTFDICIIDESTQVLQSSVIRPIYAAKTFILIGDPHQLPAVVKSKDARKMGMSESLFERLYNKTYAAVLNLNYRMNSKITMLANKLTYGGELQIGNEQVRDATIKFPHKDVLKAIESKHNWISLALGTELENAIKIIDTGAVWKLDHNASWKKNSKEIDANVNVYEAAIIVRLVKVLLKAGIKSKDIGVIAVFRAQVAQLSSVLISENVDVNTVDQFQGKDKNIIIYSCSKSKDVCRYPPGSKQYFDLGDELLEDTRRLNVAITRSKQKLIIVGDISTLLIYSPFKKIIPVFGNNIIRLNECERFQWESVLDLNSYS